MVKILKEHSVVIVEDDKLILDNMNKILSLYFKNIYGFEEAEKAFYFLQNIAQPSLIVTDIELPGISGLEFAKRVKAFNEDIEIIVLTSHVTIEYLKESVPLGLLEYLEKPVSLESLKSVLQKLSNKLNMHDRDLVTITTGIDFSIKSLELYRDNNIYTLTTKEMKCLDIFTRNRGQIISRDNLIDELWDENKGSGSALRNLFLRLRKKLGKRASIKNHYNFGYKLSCE